jgi:hypothetical protein
MYFKTLKETSVFMEEPLVISWFFLGFLAFEIFARLGFWAGTTKKIILQVSSKDAYLWYGSY